MPTLPHSSLLLWNLSLVIILNQEAAPEFMQSAAAGQQTGDTRYNYSTTRGTRPWQRMQKLLNVSISCYLKAERVTVTELERKHGEQSEQINNCFLC